MVYALVFFVALWPLAAWQARKMWNGRIDREIYSYRRARAAPAAVWLGLPVFGLGLVLVLTHGTVRTVAALLWTVVMIVSLVLLCGLYYRGWPQALVPPPLREGAEADADPPEPQQSVAVEPDAQASRRVYRDPRAVAFRLLALAIFLATEAFFIVIGIQPVAMAALAAFTLILWVPVLRAAVTTDRDGLTVLTQRGRRSRVRWSEVERFELERTSEGQPEASVALKDGDTLELEPLGGVQMQPKRQRWEWAERSIAGLSAQLERSRGAQGGREASG